MIAFLGISCKEIPKLRKCPYEQGFMSRKRWRYSGI